MIYHSAGQVLFLHDRLIEKTGGEHGVRDLGGLEAALAYPQAAFGETEFYPDIFTKVAVLQDGLTRNHAFIDDNKRISISTAALFLQVNGGRRRGRSRRRTLWGTLRTFASRERSWAPVSAAAKARP